MARNSGCRVPWGDVVLARSLVAPADAVEQLHGLGSHAHRQESPRRLRRGQQQQKAADLAASVGRRPPQGALGCFDDWLLGLRAGSVVVLVGHCCEMVCGWGGLRSLGAKPAFVVNVTSDGGDRGRRLSSWRQRCFAVAHPSRADHCSSGGNP